MNKSDQRSELTPEQRVADVVLLDLTDEEYVVGLYVLAANTAARFISS